MKPIQSILVPIDFSARSKNALGVAHDLASRFGAKLTLCHVHFPQEVAIIDYVYQESGDQIAKALAEAEKHLGEWAKEMSIAPEGFVLRALVGHPLEQLMEQSRSHDLVVMSTRGQSGLKHFFLGSVAERLVQGAHCSVFVVKDEE